MKDKTIRRVLAFFLLISVVLVAVAVNAVRNIDRAVDTSDWVTHTHAVILEVDGILTSLQAGDGALRTYVMSGDARDLAASRDALGQLEEHLEVAKALTRAEPAQNEQVLNLETLANARLEFSRRVLNARRLGETDNASALLAADDGFSAMGEIRRGVAKLKSEEMTLLADRDKEAYLQAQATRWTVWSGVGINFLLLAGAAWLIREDIAARRRAADALTEANAQLETRVQARTAELGASNEKLSSENLERRWTNQALEHQLRYNQLIINSISDLVFVLTKVTNISRINPAVVRVTGFETAELVNQPLLSIVKLADASSAMVDPLVQSLKDGYDLRDLPAAILNKRGEKIP
ncbi:MAG: CHASE3 domain-containing protein, partial [Opitutaceae bacterium]|nr:CHASE3 domain-containing protein [Opitutaceae bacterium]